MANPGDTPAVHEPPHLLSLPPNVLLNIAENFVDEEDTSSLLSLIFSHRRLYEIVGPVLSQTIRAGHKTWPSAALKYILRKLRDEAIPIPLNIDVESIKRLDLYDVGLKTPSPLSGQDMADLITRLPQLKTLRLFTFPMMAAQAILDSLFKSELEDVDIRGPVSPYVHVPSGPITWKPKRLVWMVIERYPNPAGLLIEVLEALHSTLEILVFDSSGLAGDRGLSTVMEPPFPKLRSLGLHTYKHTVVGTDHPLLQALYRSNLLTHLSIDTNIFDRERQPSPEGLEIPFIPALRTMTWTMAEKASKEQKKRSPFHNAPPLCEMDMLFLTQFLELNTQITGISIGNDLSQPTFERLLRIISFNLRRLTHLSCRLELEEELTERAVRLLTQMRCLEHLHIGTSDERDFMDVSGDQA